MFRAVYACTTPGMTAGQKGLIVQVLEKRGKCITIEMYESRLIPYDFDELSIHRSRRTAEKR